VLGPFDLLTIPITAIANSIEIHCGSHMYDVHKLKCYYCGEVRSHTRRVRACCRANNNDDHLPSHVSPM
jgi:hypothetical protein